MRHCHFDAVYHKHYLTKAVNIHRRFTGHCEKSNVHNAYTSIIALTHNRTVFRKEWRLW